MTSHMMDENVKAKSFIYIQLCRDCTFRCDKFK